MGKLQQTTRSFGHHAVSGLCSLIQDLYWVCHQIPIWRSGFVRLQPPLRPNGYVT